MGRDSLNEILHDKAILKVELETKLNEFQTKWGVPCLVTVEQQFSISNIEARFVADVVIEVKL